MHLVITSDTLAVRDGLRRLAATPPLGDLAEEARGTAEVVLAEALNNIVEHSYALAPGRIEVRLDASTRGILCEITDEGLGMPCNALPVGQCPDAEDSALEDLPEGGFGWFLIRTLTKELCYRRDGARNRLSFVLPHGIAAE